MTREKLDLSALSDIDGLMGAAVVDMESGMALGMFGTGHGVDLEIAAAGNSEVMRAQYKAMSNVGLEGVDDVLITLGKQYHLLRPLSNRKNMFIYVVLNRKGSNLAMARLRLRDYESELNL